MAEALKGLEQTSHPNLLVGFNKADDAGVYRINEHQALVQTVDFFPPIVDDPYAFGQIAAANALSDIYAMGGVPLTALNIVGFPISKMPNTVLFDTLKGGAEKVEEAGAVVVGGHSIKDSEFKYGIAATGIVHPEKFLTNATAKVGDKLFLTKPLGTGVITTAIKRNAADNDLMQLVTKQMSTLNKTAAELMVEFGAHAATDITGFGLLGHAYEVANGSGVSFEIFSNALPLLPESKRLASEGMNPGGANDNRDFLTPHVRFMDKIDAGLEALLFDPQTSGGLFISIAADKADSFSDALKKHGLPHEIIGQVISQIEAALIVRS